MVMLRIIAVDLVAFSAFECDQVYKNKEVNSSVLETNICAGAGDTKEIKENIAPVKGICFGDLGGPLFVDGVQVGISVSIAIPCGSFPTQYTAVSFYINWIVEKTGINLKPNFFLET